MSSVISPVTGTRTEPKDSYVFVRGTTATIKMIFTSDGVPVTMDTNTSPQALILQPIFLNQTTVPFPTVIATLVGSLVPGQQFEYQFTWDIPANLTPIEEYIISYNGTLGSLFLNFGDEYMTIISAPGSIGTLVPSYATVDDVRKRKFNIDDYLPKILAKDLNARNSLIQSHLEFATSRLREELNLNKQRSMTENYKLFCVAYTVWSILLASRGEDGSSISDSNLLTWKSEWERILSQEKRKSVAQSLPMGRG